MTNLVGLVSLCPKPTEFRAKGSTIEGEDMELRVAPTITIMFHWPKDLVLLV